MVEGTVENSILFRGVHVGEGSVVRDCILMQASDIYPGSELNYVILDKSVTVKDNRRLAGYAGFPIIVRKGSVI